MRTSSLCRGTRSLAYCSVATQCVTTVLPGCLSMAEQSAAPSTDKSQSWVRDSDRERERGLIMRDISALV